MKGKDRCEETRTRMVQRNSSGELWDISRSASGSGRTVAERKLSKCDPQQGFSLIESLIVIAIIGIASAMSMIAVNNILPGIRADSARQFVMNQLRQTRQASIDQRRDFWVTFQGTSEMVTVRVELTPTPPPITTTPVSDYFLPNSMVFMLFPGNPDTPDGWGGTPPGTSGAPLIPVDFNCGGAPTCKIIFRSDGSVLDSSGAAINGTLFLGVLGQPSTARAVTILGATGRIKAYRFVSGAWN